MRTVPFASLGAMTMLAGCAAQGVTRPDPAVAPPAADACGASKVSRFIGMQKSDEVLAEIESASGAQTLRVVGPNDAMTMDFREDRLTVTTDQNGRIKTLRCV